MALVGSHVSMILKVIRISEWIYKVFDLHWEAIVCDWIYLFDWIKVQQIITKWISSGRYLIIMQRCTLNESK